MSELLRHDAIDEQVASLAVRTPLIGYQDLGGASSGLGLRFPTERSLLLGLLVAQVKYL